MILKLSFISLALIIFEMVNDVEVEVPVQSGVGVPEERHLIACDVSHRNAFAQDPFES